MADLLNVKESKVKIVIDNRQNLIDEEGVQRAESKIAASFAKFGRHVTTIHLSAENMNGPRGRIHQRCVVSVRLRKKEPITVTVDDDKISRAVTRAVKAAERAVGRRIQKKLLSERGQTAGLYTSS